MSGGCQCPLGSKLRFYHFPPKGWTLTSPAEKGLLKGSLTILSSKELFHVTHWDFLDHTKSSSEKCSPGPGRDLALLIEED